MSPDRTESVFVITVEQFPMPMGTCAVRVSAPRLSLPDVRNGSFGADGTWHLYVREDRFRESPERYASYQKRLSVQAHSPSVRTFLTMLDHLRRYACEYLITPEVVEDGTIAILALSLGVPVRLACSDEWSEDVLHGLLDYFLHSPTLTVPIEPFYSLAAAIGRRSHASLWQLFDEVLGRNFFVDSTSRVSLSGRWAARELFFGGVQDTSQQFRQSKLWTDLAESDLGVFVSQQPCAFCEHYRYCRGFWATMSPSDQTCTTWRSLMDSLADAYRTELPTAGDEEHAEYPTDYIL